MTLENMLRTKLAEPRAGGPEVVVAHQGWQIALRPHAQDTLGCALDELALRRDARSDTPAAGNDPRPWAERISRTATGLLEPLRLIEVDAPQQIALLRSAAPSVHDAGLDYYEMELHGTANARLRRYRGSQQPGHKREAIPFTVTYEALAKVIGQCTAEK